MRRSKGDYSIDWAIISVGVKVAAGWKCVRCEHSHDPKVGYCLTVHHLDMDPGNNAWWNLAALCQRCHLTIQAKVVMERTWMFEHSEWFKPYVAGYYAHKFGVNEEKDYVLAHVDELIRMGQGIG